MFAVIITRKTRTLCVQDVEAMNAGFEVLTGVFRI